MLTSAAERTLEAQRRLATGDVFREAVTVAAQLLLHHPDHVKGLILMGDLQINRMRNLTYAEFCFSRAFELDPNNEQVDAMIRQTLNG
jgi:cytochrome c-type biogenesis protein CcmH/NrfG